MPADPNVYAQIKPTPILTPQQYELQRNQEQLTLADQQTKLQGVRDQAIARSVFARLGNDPEAALSELRRLAPSVAPAYEKQIAESRKSALEALKTENEVQKFRTERGLDFLQLAKATRNPAAYSAAIHNLAMDDDDAKAFPSEMPDPQTLDQMLEMGLSIKDRYDLHDTALKHYADGDLPRGFAASLLSAGDDPEAWQEAQQAGIRMGVPRALVQSFGAQPSPEALARARDLSLTEQQKETARHNQASEAAQQATADRMAAAQQETARHNRAMEARPVGGASGSARAQDAEALADTVIENPELFDQLTPTEKGRIAPILRSKGYTDFGRPLPAAAAKQISDSQTAIDSLKDLRQVLKDNEQYIGPLAGLQALNPYSEARQAQARIDLVRQRVGKALEGGVLRKEDEEKYKKILATLRDTPETAIYKVDSLIHSIEQDIANFTKQQRLSGRRVDMTTGGNAAGASIAVKAPNGKTYLFKSQADADAFKQKAGIQ